MGLIVLPQRHLIQPQYPAPLKNPGFWRLVDIQGLPPLGTAATSIVRTLNGTAKQSVGRVGKCVDFVAAGDWLSYGANPALQLSVMTGLAVLEVPSSPSDVATIFNTNVSSGAFAGGFIIRVNADGTVLALKQDVVALGSTVKTIKFGGISTVAWSYNNVSGLLRIAIDGVLESFTYAIALSHDVVGRNQYYHSSTTQAKAHRQYLFALSASDNASNAELIQWSLNPWGIFRDPAPRILSASATGGTSHDLTTENASQGNVAATGAVSQTHILVSQAAVEANIASTGAATQIHILTASASVQGNTASTGDIAIGAAPLGVDPAVQENSVADGAITQTHALSGAASAQANTASTGTVSQGSGLNAGNPAQGNIASIGAITQGHVLVTATLTQGNAAGGGVIEQTHVLVVTASVQENSTSAISVTQVHPLTADSLVQGNLASDIAISVFGELAVSNLFQSNIAGTGNVTTTQTISIASAEQDNRLTSGALRADIVFEEALATVTTQIGRIKKPGIPNDAPQWLKTMLETLTGRRNNKIDVPKAQTLTFSATPTKAECEALFSHVSEVRSTLEQLINRLDS